MDIFFPQNSWVWFSQFKWRKKIRSNTHVCIRKTDGKDLQIGVTHIFMSGHLWIFSLAIPFYWYTYIHIYQSIYGYIYFECTYKCIRSSVCIYIYIYLCIVCISENRSENFLSFFFVRSLVFVRVLTRTEKHESKLVWHLKLLRNSYYRVKINCIRSFHRAFFSVSSFVWIFSLYVRIYQKPEFLIKFNFHS